MVMLMGTRVGKVFRKSPSVLREKIMTLFDVTVWEAPDEISGGIKFTNIPAKTKYEACKVIIDFYREFLESESEFTASAKVVR